MPKTRKEKEESTDSLTELIKKAVSVVFVQFDKLKVIDERALRNQLRESGSGYSVVKKTLWRKAMEKAGYPEAPELSGQIALAHGADPIAPAKGVASFGKKHEGVLSILGGIFEGKLKTGSEMSEIALIPDRQTLLGMLANVLNSPIRGLAVAVDAVAKQKTST